MPKLSNPSKTQRVKMLDRRWSAFVRSHGRCENCGTREALTDSHIIGRSYVKTRFDPRNNQCLCFSCHGKFESQPVAFARWVEGTSCGQYVDVMLLQANNSVAKPDYDLWQNLYDHVVGEKMSVEDARQYLGQQVLLSSYDLLLLS